MIVVEGMDGSGKSTLVKGIAENFKLTTHHGGGPPKTLDEVYNCLARCELRMMQSCVQDRVTHISETVYGMFSRPDMAGAAMMALPHLAKARLVIYCRPPDNVILYNLGTTHAVKAHETPEHVAKVKADATHLIKIYDTVMAAVSRATRVFYYDYTRDGETNRVMRMVDVIAYSKPR